MRWRKRPAPPESISLTSAPDLGWGGGMFHARIAFGGEGAAAKRASLEALLMAKGASIPEHDHPSWEHIAVLAGSGRFKLGGSDYPVKPGSIFHIPIGVRHSFAADAGSEVVAVQLYSPSGPEQRFVKLAAGLVSLTRTTPPHEAMRAPRVPAATLPAAAGACVMARHVRGKSREGDRPMKNHTFPSLLLLLASGTAVGCARDNDREPVLVPASGTTGGRASSQPTEPAPSIDWPAPNLNEELELDQSGEQPTKLSRPLAGALPARAALETSSGSTGTGQIPGRVPAAREVELMLDQAATRITASRCERAFACQNVGSGRSFGTHADCRRRLGSDTRRALGASCSEGIDANRLGDCEREIRGEDCNLALDALENAASCRASALCNR